jgi:hypothetical protein
MRFLSVATSDVSVALMRRDWYTGGRYPPLPVAFVVTTDAEGIVGEVEGPDGVAVEAIPIA